MKRMLKTAARILLVAALLAALALRIFTPQRAAARFVAGHGDAFAALVASGQAVPAVWQGQKVGVWAGEHTIYQFTLGHGVGHIQYWGVYYSPDDLPAAFQNSGEALVPSGTDSWTWQAQGDNHGATSKIAEHWYYFEAAF